MFNFDLLTYFFSKLDLVPRPDLSVTALLFITAFREGKLGRVMLDDDLIKES